MTEEIAQPGKRVPTLIEVWAPSCSACRAIQPDLMEAAESWQSEVVLQRVDASTDRPLTRDLGVMGTPSFIGMKDGREVFRRTGRVSRAEIEGMFEALANDAHLEPPRRHTESVLAVAAGAVLLVAGMLTGPSLALVIVGGTLMLGGAGLWSRRQRDD